jgi:hypothetical protein
VSSIARWANTQLATIWRQGEKDEFGQFTWSLPEYVLVSYRLGGSEQYVDSTGVKFMPKSTYWTEMLMQDGTFADKPSLGDKMQLGEQLGNPTSEADDLRSVQIDDATMFGASEMPDYMVMT